MLRLLLIILSIYLLYKIIFDFVIPVFRTTRKIRKQFQSMQQHMQDQMNTHQNEAQSQQKGSVNERPAPKHDYIDFEEVK